MILCYYIFVSRFNHNESIPLGSEQARELLVGAPGFFDGQLFGNGEKFLPTADGRIKEACSGYHPAFVTYPDTRPVLEMLGIVPKDQDNDLLGDNYLLHDQVTTIMPEAVVFQTGFVDERLVPDGITISNERSGLFGIRTKIVETPRYKRQLYNRTFSDALDMTGSNTHGDYDAAYLRQRPASIGYAVITQDRGGYHPKRLRSSGPNVDTRYGTQFHYTALVPWGIGRDFLRQVMDNPLLAREVGNAFLTIVQQSENNWNRGLNPDDGRTPNYPEIDKEILETIKQGGRAVLGVVLSEPQTDTRYKRLLIPYE